MIKKEKKKEKNMHLKTVAKYIRRSPYQAIAAILIMTFTFFIISIFSILTISSVRIINYFESKPQLTIFFQDEATQEEVSALRKKIESTGKISKITYLSKDDALKFYKELNKDDPILLDLVTADILPASFDIQATEAKSLSEISSIVKNSPIIRTVVFQKNIVDRLVLWINTIKTIGVVIIGFLVVESIFIIVTIVAFKIIMRREEIEIMKLIGATNWYIRMPFIIEGMIYGCIGALLGWSFSYLILLYFTPNLATFLEGISLFPIPFTIMLEVLGIEVVTATILGVFASFLAVLRYLK